jgi:hypothetical protein
MISDYVSQITGAMGQYPAFTSVGGYSLFYATESNNAVCASCVNTEESFQTEDSPDTNIAKCDVHWEGSAIECSCCGENIESSYGEPDT